MGSLLTLGDDQRRVEQEVAHQLGGQLVEEAAGDCPVEYGILILHHVHQGDGRRARLLGHTLDLRVNTHTHTNRNCNISFSVQQSNKALCVPTGPILEGLFNSLFIANTQTAAAVGTCIIQTSIQEIYIMLSYQTSKKDIKNA